MNRVIRYATSLVTLVASLLLVSTMSSAQGLGTIGVGWIQLVVRDVDALMKTFIERRVRIVSTALQPVDFDDSRRVVVRDPDGVYVELIQPRH